MNDERDLGTRNIINDLDDIAYFGIRSPASRPPRVLVSIFGKDHSPQFSSPLSTNRSSEENVSLLRLRPDYHEILILEPSESRYYSPTIYSRKRLMVEEFLECFDRYSDEAEASGN